MRLASLPILVILAACGSGPPLEELESEALATGDWSGVEQREAVLRERQERHTATCATGRIWVCIEDPSRDKCGCVRISDSR